MMSWPDRLTVALGVPALLVLGHIWLATLPLVNVVYIAQAAGFLSGFMAVEFVIARLRYHQTDGILAEDALQQRIALPYACAAVSIWLASMAIIIAGLAPQGLLAAVLTMGAGIILAWLKTYLSGSTVIGQRAWATLHAALPWLRTPIAGLVLSALFGIILMIAANSLPPEGAWGVAGLTALVLGLPLAGVDSQTVVFMAKFGFSPLKTCIVHQRNLAGFSLLAMMMAFLLAGLTCLGVVAVVLLALHLITIIRILSYRTHAKRTADWIVSVLAILFCLVGFFTPIALPVVVGIAIYWLWHRAKQTTWLIT